MTISGSKVSRIPQAKARPRLKKCTDFSTIPSWKAVKMNFCNLTVFPTTLSFRIMDVSNRCIWKVTTIRRNHILNWTMILGRVHSPKQTAKLHRLQQSWGASCWLSIRFCSTKPSSTEWKRRNQAKLVIHLHCWLVTKMDDWLTSLQSPTFSILINSMNSM